MLLRVISDTLQEFQGTLFTKSRTSKYFKGYLNNKRTYLHRRVWEYYNGEIPVNFHVHHKDENPSNNNIENLEIKHKSDHLREHMTPERRAKSRARMPYVRQFADKWHGSPKGKKFHSKLAKQTWANKKPIHDNCAHCGKEYTKWLNRKRDRFCGQNCQMRARRRRLLGLPEDFVLTATRLPKTQYRT